MADISLRSLTYVSQATVPLSDEEFRQLGSESGRLNTVDGVTGLLVYNGDRFCQTIEGRPDVIGSLLDRLRRDGRHFNMRVTEDGPVPERRFRSWDMQLLRVPGDRAQALTQARGRLSGEADIAARAKIYEAVAASFPDA